ncbi:hypothetical protein FA15DRAFT_516083 [Coprinopsis marcescibilis]|uniref:Uncharacterized protein n=1 Tax=Coprinopsis marcescibilis TaxID=230819 RepID=A0A5C3L303_COPMA|nr:hypothetical protein FA15DRAFT_516083 [Coprinopsis marcescibilis]
MWVSLASGSSTHQQGCRFNVEPGKNLCSSFWRELVAKGATVKRTKHLDTAPSRHIEVLRHILNKL